MTERVDYEIGDNLDIESTDWQDFKTVRDTDVLTQNFVLLAAGHGRDLLGEQLTATAISRFRKRLESQFREKESVDTFFVENIELDGNELSYSLVIGSDEYEETVILP